MGSLSSGDDDDALLSQAQALRDSIVHGRRGSAPQPAKSRGHDRHEGRMRKTSSSDEELTRLVREYRSALAGTAADYNSRSAQRMPSFAKPARQQSRSTDHAFSAAIARGISATEVSACCLATTSVRNCLRSVWTGALCPLKVFSEEVLYLHNLLAVRLLAQPCICLFAGRTGAYAKSQAHVTQAQVSSVLQRGSSAFTDGRQQSF